MTIYSTRHGFRYDFTVKGKRYTKSGFGTKREAAAAQAERRKAVKEGLRQAMLGDMGLFSMLNMRLDFMLDRSYSKSYYKNTRYAAQRALDYFGRVTCGQITTEQADAFLIDRHETSGASAANDGLRLLRASFSWAKGRGQRYITNNPFAGLESFPSDRAEEKKRTPTPEELDLVIEAAKEEDRAYFWVMRETLARSIEVHRLTWDRVNFEDRYVELMTYKNKDRKPVLRQVPMTDKLYEVLMKLYGERDPDMEWVFWTRSYDHAAKQMVKGPYRRGRYSVLQTACKEAGVEYFSWHRVRASGASVMDNNGALLTGIQHVLGHADRRSTEIYLEKLRAVERDAMDVYEKASRKAA